MNLIRILFIAVPFILSACNNKGVDIKEDFDPSKGITNTSCDYPIEGDDYRQYQHGIDFIQKNDSIYYLIWGSSGIPPKGASSDGSWTHDIYYSELNINKPVIKATSLISANEAQEPPSSAISPNGNIFITMEDGNDAKNSVAQRYSVYDREMKVLKAYPNTIFDGGHSGHVANVGNLFVVFWSNNWDDSVPGADGIGTGLDVLADIYSAGGSFLRRIDVATDEKRDWWPIVAGSENNACLVWQRYEQGDKYALLMYSILNTETGELLKNQIKLESLLKYYTYDVQYYPSVKKFVIVGTYYNGGGFAILMDENGEIIHKINDIPAIVREAQGVARTTNNDLLIAYAQENSGVMLLKVSNTEINYLKTIKDNYNWYGIGADGVFLNDSCLYMINLSPCGLVKRQINIDL